MAKECAESYFYYGKALLELSRLESGVLGNALEGVPEGDDANNSRVEDPEKMTEDEKNEIEQKVGEALEENFDSLQKKDEKSDESKNQKSEKTSESQDNEASGSKAKEAGTTEEEGMEEDTNDSTGKEWTPISLLQREKKIPRVKTAKATRKRRAMKRKNPLIFSLPGRCSSSLR